MFVFKNRYVKTDLSSGTTDKLLIILEGHAMCLSFFLIDMDVREYGSRSGVPPLWKAQPGEGKTCYLVHMRMVPIPNS